MQEVEYDGHSFEIGSRPSAITLAKILQKPENYQSSRKIKSMLIKYNEMCNDICNSDILNKHKHHLLILLRQNFLDNLKRKALSEEIKEFTQCAIVGKYREALRYLEGKPSNIKVKEIEIEFIDFISDDLDFADV